MRIKGTLSVVAGLALIALAVAPLPSAWVGPPPKEWDMAFGGANGDAAWSVQKTAAGGYILAGETCSYGAGG